VERGGVRQLVLRLNPWKGSGVGGMINLECGWILTMVSSRKI
jgi:hypothetical protein